ncbi:Glutathione S-transferase, N-terminal [Dillenia turbinata]|uniref:glutathione transferase n=1 Tax=Dillenia turbinata TaxID=194707 RepID=A0AAN8ZFV3_9MAGN
MGTAGEAKVELIGQWASPFVKRVKWVLRMKGFEYEYVEEDVRNKSERLLSTNPVHKKVPVLVHNGKPIAVSCLWMILFKGLRLAFGPNLLKTRKVLFLKGDEQEEVVKQAIEALDALEGELNAKKFFGGDQVGLVDIVLGWATIWLGVIEEVSDVKLFDSEKHPSLACWMKNFTELSVVKEDIPPRDQLVDYFDKIRNYGPSLPPPPPPPPQE